MQRRSFFSLLVSVCALLGATFAAAEAPAFRPATAADIAIPQRPRAVTDDGIALAATELEVAAGCTDRLPRHARVDLRWKQGETPALSAQRVDISKLPEGFRTGRYETTGSLGATAREVRVEAPEPGVNYYWRVFTVTAEGWVESPVARFQVPICPADELEPDQAEGLVLNPNSESR